MSLIPGFSTDAAWVSHALIWKQILFINRLRSKTVGKSAPLFSGEMSRVCALGFWLQNLFKVKIDITHQSFLQFLWISCSSIRVIGLHLCAASPRAPTPDPAHSDYVASSGRKTLGFSSLDILMKVHKHFTIATKYDFTVFSPQHPPLLEQSRWVTAVEQVSPLDKLICR